MKIFTYHENINFKNQLELVQLWKKSWEMQGFEACILTREDAERSPYYKEFVTNIKQVHIDIAGHEIRPYGLSCYLRWLAYSVQKDQELFLVSDYDVINKNFKTNEIIESCDKISFMDRYCPCLAYGSSEQFLTFCKNIISISNQNKDSIKQNYQIKSLSHYHDQEFLLLNHGILFNYNICPARKYVALYEHNNPEMEKYNLFHIAHRSVHEAKINYPQFGPINSDQLRIILTFNILNK